MQRELFHRFPRLKETMPFTPLGTYPTAVQRLSSIERVAGLSAELWVKRDDLSGEPWGMSKSRKLEHYFGDAQAAGAKRLVTFGPLGSNHALATALYAHQLGFEVELQLWPEPTSERVRHTLLAEFALGAKLTLVGTLDERALAMKMDEDETPAPSSQTAPAVYAIPPAGTDAIGAMGYVEAGLELAAQVAKGELPEPDFVHVAGGTGGVSAGLAVGLRLAGLRSRVVSIRCVAPEVLTELRLVFLARRIHQRLARLAEVKLDSLPRPKPEDFLILHAHAGTGYGKSTIESQQAQELFATKSNLILDPIYTSKAAAGVLAFASSPEGTGKRHLFWHTYAHRDLSGLGAKVQWQQLPQAFHKFFEK